MGSCLGHAADGPAVFRPCKGSGLPYPEHVEIPGAYLSGDGEGRHRQRRPEVPGP